MDASEITRLVRAVIAEHAYVAERVLYETHDDADAVHQTRKAPMDWTKSLLRCKAFAPENISTLRELLENVPLGRRLYELGLYVAGRGLMQILLGCGLPEVLDYYPRARAGSTIETLQRIYEIASAFSELGDVTINIKSAWAQLEVGGLPCGIRYHFSAYSVPSCPSAAEVYLSRTDLGADGVCWVGHDAMPEFNSAGWLVYTARVEVLNLTTKARYTHRLVAAAKTLHLDIYIPGVTFSERSARVLRFDECTISLCDMWWNGLSYYSDIVEHAADEAPPCGPAAAGIAYLAGLSGGEPAEFCARVVFSWGGSRRFPTGAAFAEHVISKAFVEDAVADAVWAVWAGANQGIDLTATRRLRVRDFAVYQTLARIEALASSLKFDRRLFPGVHALAVVDRTTLSTHLHGAMLEMTKICQPVELGYRPEPLQTRALANWLGPDNVELIHL